MSGNEGGARGEPGGASPRWLLGLRRFDSAVQRVEVVLCTGALLWMILLASLQILLRWGQALMPSTFSAVDWFDVVARLMVLWVGVLGASLAAAEGRHIAIELLPKFLGPRGRRRLDATTSLVTAGLTGLVLGLACIYFLRSVVPDERHLFIIQSFDLPVPKWPFLLVLPLGLLVITWRFALRGLEALLLGDADYVDREDELAREMAEFERLREAETAAAMVAEDQRQARESGRKPELDPESARQQLREMLHQDPASDGRGDPAPTAPPPKLPAPPKQPRPLVGRSTDEIPVYRDLAEEEDLIEPERREPQPGARIVDSSDMLSSTSDMISSDGLSTYDELAEDAVESVAETQRLREEPEDDHGETAPELTPHPAPPPPEGAPPPADGPAGRGA